MYGRSLEEDIDYWMGDIDDYPGDAMLPHLTDADIYGLGDSYDDGRIGTLIGAYVELRSMMKGLQK